MIKYYFLIICTVSLVFSANVHAEDRPKRGGFFDKNYVTSDGVRKKSSNSEGESNDDGPDYSDEVAGSKLVRDAKEKQLQQLERERLQDDRRREGYYNNRYYPADSFAIRKGE